MTGNEVSSWLVRAAAVCIGACMVCGAMAAEFHGTVKTSGLPLPGVTVTATQGEKKVATTTDERGVFSFAELEDGTQMLAVETLGFAKSTREVGVANGAPAAEFSLKILTEAALLAAMDPGGAATAPVARAAGGRGAPGSQTGFQRVNVSQSADTRAITSEGAMRSEEVADLTQSAANSFIVQGSISSAAGLPQMNDWGPPGGRGMGMDGMGGMGGPGGDAAGAPVEMAMAGGRGGGPGSGGGRGGMGGGPGGRGGPGGPEGMGGRGGRGGPDWQGRPNAMAFGNGRRDPRMSYNGNASFSLDNSIWDARSYSVTGAEVDKPSFANGRGSIMVGGPLRIPKLVSASKRIMFTLDLQMQRNHTGTVSDPVNMPTALERIGDFSQTTLAGAALTVLDPLTGLPFPGNVIPASRISTTSTGLLAYFPNPNLPYATRNYQTSWSGRNNSQNINSRISNMKLDAKDTLNFGLGYQGSSSVTPNLFGFVDMGAGRGLNANLAWSRTITARVINNLRYTFSRSRQQATPYFAGTTNVSAELGIQGTSQNPANWGPPNLSFTNYGGLTDGNYSLTRNQTSAVAENITWVHGKHNFSFGGDYRRQQNNQLADSNGRGTYLFNGLLTGYDLADFLLGVPTTSSIRYGNPDKYFRSSAYDAFVNDDFRITTKFSLNFGLRWDYATPVTELYDRMVNLEIAPGYTAAVAVLPGSENLPSSLVRPDRNNFSPRVGFAWRPSNKGTFVVRGGYGAYYNTSVYNVIAGNMAQQPPFAQSLSASQSVANPFNITNGFLVGTNETLNSTFAIDPNYRVGYAQTWQLSVQHDLPLGMFATAGYLGTKGTRLDQQFIPNSVAPGATQSLWPHYFTYETSNGNSIYHAAQFQLNRRFRSGIMANSSYQFSKSIDNAGTGGRGQGNTPVAQNWMDLSAERGLSSFDARHNLTVQLQYSSGMGRSGGTLINGWKGTLLKDWTIGSNISLRSGNPFTATVGGSRSQVGGTAVSNTVRADATGLPVMVDGMLFNTAAFAAPVSGLWGTAGRNTIPGPTMFSLNGSVGRVFRFGERRSADLQFQAQNVLNHVTITNWGTVVGSTNFGLASSAAAMRRMTISLRFRF